MSKLNSTLWRVEVAGQCERQITKLDRINQERILFALCTLEKSGIHRKNIRQIEKEAEWVMKVGGWRILLRTDSDTKTVVVLNLGEKRK